MAVDYRAGDYRVVADRLRPAAQHLVAAVEPGPGDVVVDVAAGSGNVARLAVGRGARAVAVDLVREQLLLGRNGGAPICWVQGDAQALPLADGVGTAVLSTFGVIYAPRPDDVVREMSRVCAPGGAIGLTAWPEGGWQAAQARALVELVPDLRQAGHDHLAAWGTPEAVRGRLAEVADDVDVTTGELVGEWESPQAWWAQRAATAPPVVSARRALDDDGFAELGRRMVALAEEHGEDVDDGLVLRDQYLVAVARRR